MGARIRSLRYSMSRFTVDRETFISSMNADSGTIARDFSS